jgi:hypothetical protein
MRAKIGTPKSSKVNKVQKTSPAAGDNNSTFYFSQTNLVIAFSS